MRPDHESKPTISRYRFSTLISRGFHGDQESGKKPVTSPFPKNKPRIQPLQKWVAKKKTQIALKVPRRKTGLGRMKED
jgi:hypothetical protein